MTSSSWIKSPCELDSSESSPPDLGPLAPEIEHQIHAARESGESAVGRLLELYRGYLLSIANEGVGTDIVPKVAPSDVVQETFLQAYRDFPGFQGTTELELRDWLRAILLNNVRDAYRHYRGALKRRVSQEQPWDLVDSKVRQADTLDSRDRPSQMLQASEAIQGLHAALSRLPEEYRQVIRRRNFDGVAFEIIGKELNRSADAVRKLWGRAVRKLTEELNVDGLE